MKKLFCMILIGSIALSMTACGGKKKEEEKSSVEETKQIEESAVALSSEPEEPEVVEYTCLPEMYEAELEDGLIQIEDILIDTKKSQTLGEICALFPESRFSLIIERAGKKTDPYTKEAIAAKGEYVRLNVMKNNAMICNFDFYNADKNADFTPLDNCSYYSFFLDLNYEFPIWIAKGISPFELYYTDLEEFVSNYDYEKHGATQYWIDFAESDIILAQGGPTVKTDVHYNFVIDKSTSKVGWFTLRNNVIK